MLSRPAILAAALALGGCGTLQSAFAPDYTLHASPKIINADRFYNTDMPGCIKAADAATIPLSVPQAVGAAVSGAGDNAANAIVNPLFPAAGAAGGALSSVANGFGLAPQEKRGIFLNCMREETHADGSGRIYDSQ